MELGVKAVPLVFIFSFSAVCSNPGSEFLLAFPQNYNNGQDDMNVLITSVVDTNINVNLTFNAPPDFVPPSDVHFMVAPHERYQLKVSGQLRISTGSLKENKSMTIRSSDNITVEVFNRHGSNGDAYLALPKDGFGTEFFAVNYEILHSDTASYIVVVAAEDDTAVRIQLVTFQSDFEVEFEGRYYGSSDTLMVQLSAGEVFQLQLEVDLTGSRVTSDLPVFLISGQNRTMTIHKTCKSHLMDAVPPLERISTEYVTVSFPDIGSFYRDDGYRIISTSINTTVTIGGTDQITLERDGDFHDLFVGAFKYYWIQSNKPIYVAQISSSNFNNTERFGDPSLMILTPLPAEKSSYIFSTMKYSDYRAFLTVVIEASFSSTLQLDESTFTTDWYHVTGKPSLFVGMVEINQTVSESHRVHHPGGVGFLAYLQAGEKCEAYALPLSYHSASTPTPCEAAPGFPGDGIDNNCNGEIDEEICCVDNGDPGITYYKDIKTRDCLAPTGYTANDIICCGENNQPFVCRESAISSLSSAFKRRKFSTSIDSVYAKKPVNCNLKCLIQPLCWGFNFNTKITGGSDNCELLVGDPTGSADDLSWVYYAMKKNPQYS